MLAGIWPLRAAPAEPGAAPPPLAPEIPGYELRALAVHKRVLFQVGKSRVEVSVPVFVYCPAAGAPPMAQLVRKAQAALVKLAAKPEWTAAELREVIAGLEQAARLLELLVPPGTPAPAVRE